ncbi:MAG: PEP-CTERM system histidine kinase PrsK [Alteromonadaceae bacterium]|nr:PEP-CTERM system histidine kinase PrsK [Alteromonadaceae bacterium]
MLRDPGIISYGLAVALYAMLSAMVAVRYLRRNIDRALLVAALVSCLWALLIAGQALTGGPNVALRYLFEVLRDGAWILLLLAILHTAAHQKPTSDRVRVITRLGLVTLALALIVLVAVEWLISQGLLNGKSRLIGQIGLSLIGLSLVEQIWRNSPGFGRSALKYLCIGVVTIFAYDFLMYADALLFGRLSDPFWQARGLVNAALVPLFAVNIINTRRQPVDFRLSRTAVFHAGTLVLGGGYLLFLALGGYYVQALGGHWGEALQVVFVTLALVFLLTVLLSRRVRARMMVFIGQNFFDYKYDYREEWLKMTRELADLEYDSPLSERVISFLAGLVESNRGAIWLKDDTGHYALKATLNLATGKHGNVDYQSPLVEYFRHHEWIVDFNEYRSDPATYDFLELPENVQSFEQPWLLIPLYLGNELYGFCLICSPYTRVDLNWENFDLIKVVARQACNLLAQEDAQNRLLQARQFEAVNKVSAFMVHDLKTLIAQLSLLVKNAPRHRNNPAFVDDMIATTDHAVRKMSNLLEHLRNPDSQQQAPRREIDFVAVLREVLERTSQNHPVPRLNEHPDSLWLCANAEKLRAALEHLIRNAQDATPANGEIILSLKVSPDHAVLFIQDSGCGMTEEFIRDQLFKPFESTKGLTGMGIGAYQAREYIRELGGEINVTSKPGAGSCFSIAFPVTV